MGLGIIVINKRRLHPIIAISFTLVRSQTNRENKREKDEKIKEEREREREKEIEKEKEKDHFLCKNIYGDQ